MRQRLCGVVAAGAGVGFCAAQTVRDPRFVIDTVVPPAGMLSTIAFLESDDLLLCRLHSGQVVRWRGGVSLGVVLDLPVSAVSERGLLGVALHPDFVRNGYAYFYYSRAAVDGGAWLDNRVERYRWNGTSFDPATATLIVSFPYDANQNNGPNHNGGIILFGPDGKLYGVTGDMNRSGLEQNVTAARIAGVGGVFRLNDDGSIPADNPFIDHPAPQIQRLYAYGVRNSFGLAFDEATGRLWDTENGPSWYDEINCLHAGFNSGWLPLMGPDERDPQSAADLIYLPGAYYADPVFSWRDTIAPTAIVFLNSERMPCDLRGQALVGACNDGLLYRFSFTPGRDAFVLPGPLADRVADDNAEAAPLVWGTGFGCTTDLKLGPDGHLYHVAVDGAVRRIRAQHPLGDMNNDGGFNNFDIDAFALALSDRSAYLRQFPGVDPDERGDANCDGALNNFDIDEFARLLTETL
jgi:glucose/arabinose dehydrogenase